MDRTGTPVFGVETVKAALELGGADPVSQQQVLAVMVDQVAMRAAEKACEAQEAKRQATPPEGISLKEPVSGWIKWGVAPLVMVLGLLWGASQLFWERPTETKVEKMIKDSHAQHPESKAGIEANRADLVKQGKQLERIESGVDNVQTAVDELKKLREQDIKRQR